MSSRRRLRREDPERFGPTRKWEATQHAASSWRGTNRDVPLDVETADPFRDRRSPADTLPYEGGPPYDAAIHPPYDRRRPEEEVGGPEAQRRHRRGAVPPETEPCSRRGGRWDSGRWPGFEWRDVIDEGVHMGYRVIEEHIRQGQRAAQQFRDRQYDAHTLSDELWQFFQQALRYSEDLIALLYDLMASLTGPHRASRHRFGAPGSRGNPWSVPRHDAPYPDSRWPEQASPPWSAFHREPFYGPSAPWNEVPDPLSENDKRHPLAVSVELVAHQPVRVNLDLPPEVVGEPLSVQELSASSAGKPPLSEVVFATRDQRSCLRITIPEQQPGGLYTGSVVERQSGLVCGKLSVHVGEGPDETPADSGLEDTFGL